MLILVLSFAVLLVIGVPIAYALGLSSLLYFLIEQPDLAVVVPQRIFSGMNNQALIALPLFILMGQVMNSSGITARLIDLSMAVVGRLRGGLGLVNVFSSMIFGGISGSSTSDTASIGSVMIPEMRKRGYSAGFASGITVASSTMGMIIPPSVPIVLYAIVAQESVGRLFLGGLIPGIMIGVLQIGVMLAIANRRRYPREAPAAPEARLQARSVVCGGPGNAGRRGRGRGLRHRHRRGVRGPRRAVRGAARCAAERNRRGREAARIAALGGDDERPDHDDHRLFPAVRLDTGAGARTGGDRRLRHRPRPGPHRPAVADQRVRS